MNHNRQLFISATINWIHQGDHYCQVIETLNEALETCYPGRTVEWRTDTVTDFRGFTVPVSAERLVRWDRRHPNEIFADGFVPRSQPGWAAVLPYDSFDLGTYVNDNVASVFVGTARYYRQENRPTRWIPRNRYRIFEYEVFAYGGIDVNISLGASHPYWNQREIAFPGGIRPEVIRTAREYDENGHVVRLWLNRGFDISANGPEHSSALGRFPDPVCGVHVQGRAWTGENQLVDQPDTFKRELRDADGQSEDDMRQPGGPEPDDLMQGDDMASQNEDDMRQPGDPEPDDLMVGDCTANPARACFQVPGVPKEAYFFGDTRYVRITVDPGTIDDRIVTGPGVIISQWPSLRKAVFISVDAALPSPNGGGETYFFSGTQYAFIKVIPGTQDDYIIAGPRPIAGNWPSLDKAGFHTIDAILPSPNGGGETYFFSGTQYALIKVVPGTTDDYIIRGPNPIAGNWPSLDKAGFHTIDAILPSPNGGGETYFFSGTQYALIKVTPGTTDDYIIRGPNSAAGSWPSLVKSNLY